MKYFLFLFFPFSLFVLPSCSQKENEQEPDYDHLVILEEEEEEWAPGQESIGKETADLDPQEFMIFDPELKTEHVLEDDR